VENSDIISFSDASGQFTLHDLAPGKWRISVDTSILSGEMQNTRASFAEVTMASNGVQSGIELAWWRCKNRSSKASPLRIQPRRRDQVEGSFFGQFLS